MAAPVLTVSQMRAWEKSSWDSGISQEAVIERAGNSFATALKRWLKPDHHILVLAGKGHNGDDAAVAARSLTNATLLRVTSPVDALPIVKEAVAQKPHWIIDGLFGIGLNRSLSKDWVELVDLLNGSGSKIASVDIPSGLHADSGEPVPVAIRADMTVTLAAVKQGLLKPSAWPFVGRLEIADNIGLTPCPYDTEIKFTLAPDFHGFPPRRPIAGHKGTFGHLAIIAGSQGYHGAAVLAARGAQRAQPGLTTLYTMPEVFVPVAAQCQAVMVRSWQQDISRGDYSAIVAGPGLASKDVPDSCRDVIASLWSSVPVPMIVDASALQWIGLPLKKLPRIITPHPGEAARLLGIATKAVQDDRPGSVRALSKKFGCLVALKGHQTIIGSSDGPLFVNGSGNAFLAQGGSGDLLAGYIGGLLAQPALALDPLRALRCAVWQHGASADELSACMRNWIVEDLAVCLGSSV